MTATTDTKPATTDAYVLALKENGATWKFIALEFGWGWNGTNMDGGRAKRAYLRARKAGVDATEVELPEELATKLAEAKAPKAKAAKAKAVKPVVEDEDEVEATPEAEAPKPQAPKRATARKAKTDAEAEAPKTRPARSGGRRAPRPVAARTADVAVSA